MPVMRPSEIVPEQLESASLEEEILKRPNNPWASGPFHVCRFGRLQSRNSANAKAAVRAPVPAVPVGVATVKQRDFPVYLTGLGSVQAFNTVSLKTRIDGQITQVNFEEGQDVKQGELLI